MAKFAYNIIKNVSIYHILFKLKYDEYLHISFKDKIDPCLNFYLANELVKELRNLRSICQQNLFYTQQFQKQVYDITIKFYNYILGEKIRFNNIYISTKQNQKLESKFFWLVPNS